MIGSSHWKILRSICDGYIIYVGREEMIMYTKKNECVFVTPEKEIKVVGLSFLKLKEIGAVNDKMQMYGYFQKQDEWRSKINNLVKPGANFAVWHKTVGDVIIGAEVSEFGEQDGEFVCFTIPVAEYVKVLWNAEHFGDLVSKRMWGDKEQCDRFYKEHQIKAGNALGIEVYPQDSIAWEHPEMYGLLSFEKKA